MACATMTKGAELCTSCNMCCSGALFSHVILEDAEHASLAQTAPDALRQDKKALAQPCSLLKTCGSCSIYKERPKGCDAYSCQTLLKLKEGEITSDQAHKVIAHAKKFRDQVLKICETSVPAAAWKGPYADPTFAIKNCFNYFESVDSDTRHIKEQVTFFWIIHKLYFQKNIHPHYE